MPKRPKIRWCLFDHPVAALRDGKPQRGMFATHLADVDSDGDPKPLCETEAIYVNANEPSGFVLVCVRCLVRAEVRL